MLDQFDQLMAIAAELPGQVKSSDQWEEAELLERLQAKGFSVSRQSLKRMINGLCIRKGPGGYYEDLDVLVVLSWLQKRENYYSYAQFLQTELSAIREYFSNRTREHGNRRDCAYADQSW